MLKTAPGRLASNRSGKDDFKFFTAGKFYFPLPASFFSFAL